MASSISDPLTLLREYTIAKKTVTREGGHIVFDRTRFAASAPTAYRGGDGFYSIESLWFMLQHAETGAGKYIRECTAHKIPPVKITERKAALAYLTGAAETSAAIDHAGAARVAPVPEVAPTEEVEAAMEVEEAEPQEEYEAEPEDEATALERAARAAEAEERQRAHVAEAKASLRALLDAPQSDAKDGDDQDGKGKESRARPMALVKPYLKQDFKAMKGVVKKEKRLRTRSSVLLAGKGGFPFITQILDGFRRKNKAILDREEAARKKGRNPAARPADAPRPSGAPGASGKAEASRSRRQSGGGPAEPAIIIVPSSITSLIATWNAGALLGDAAMWRPPAEVKADADRALKEAKEEADRTAEVEREAAGGVSAPGSTIDEINARRAETVARAEERAAKPRSVKFRRTFDDRSSGSFVVLDNPSKLSASDWARVVCVFVSGSAWQFKGWPFKDPAHLFSKVSGFSLRFSDERPNQTVKGWNVTHLIISKTSTKQHEVGVAAMNFWTAVHKFMAQQKPHLLTRPGAAHL